MCKHSTKFWFNARKKSFVKIYWFRTYIFGFQTAVWRHCDYRIHSKLCNYV